MSSSTTNSIASLFTTTMFMMALSFTAEAIMVQQRSLADRRSSSDSAASSAGNDQTSVAVDSRPSPIGMTVFVYGDGDDSLDGVGDGVAHLGGVEEQQNMSL